MTSYVFWPTMWPSSGMENTKGGYITEYKMKWPHGWPKHIGGHSVYTLILMHLCACVGTTIIYIYIYKVAHYSLTFRNETV